MSNRLPSGQRMAQILQAAYDLADEGALYEMSMHQIAKRAGCSRPLIKHHYQSLTRLREAVVQEAIRVENLSILALALAKKEPAAFKAPLSLQDKAIESLKG